MRIDIQTRNTVPQSNLITDLVFANLRPWDGGAGGWQNLDLAPIISPWIALPPPPIGTPVMCQLPPIGESAFGRATSWASIGWATGQNCQFRMWVYWQSAGGSLPFIRIGLNDAVGWAGGLQIEQDLTGLEDTWQEIVMNWVYPPSGAGTCHLHIFMNEAGPRPPLKASEGGGSASLGLSAPRLYRF